MPISQHAFLPTPGQCSCSFSMHLGIFQEHFLFVILDTPKPSSKSSVFLPISEWGQAAPQFTYLMVMVTAEVGRLDVNTQDLMQAYIM